MWRGFVHTQQAGQTWGGVQILQLVAHKTCQKAHHLKICSESTFSLLDGLLQGTCRACVTDNSYINIKQTLPPLQLRWLTAERNSVRLGAGWRMRTCLLNVQMLCSSYMRSQPWALQASKQFSGTCGAQTLQTQQRLPGFIFRTRYLLSFTSLSTGSTVGRVVKLNASVKSKSLYLCWRKFLRPALEPAALLPCLLTLSS